MPSRSLTYTGCRGQPGRVTHVAEMSGTMVGFLSAVRLLEPEPEVEMTALYVLPTHGVLGAGSRLHDLFEGEVRPALLEVWAGNDRAVAFYRRRGWIPTSTTRPGPQGVDFGTYRLPPGTRG